jgi:aspartyl-tRNA(Asn)/glutamyl-tRNA(Gln) amidotransferase subunit A
MLGTFALASGYYDQYYGRAQRVRTLIVREFAQAFEGVDVLASPTSPTVAFPIGDRTADPYAMYLADVCTIPASLAGLPAISIPCGLSDGLPVGLQLAGPAFSENRLLDAAHALEKAIAFDTRPPGLAT